jgi:hypothetical protein
MNRAFNDPIGDQVRSAGDDGFARSGYTANLAGTGHTGNANNCLMNAPDGAFCRSGVFLGNEVKDVL